MTVHADSSWTGHIRATLALGLPLVGSQLATIGFGVSDSLMLGRLGAEPLAASVLGTTLFFVIYITGAGFAQAVAPIVATAIGAGDDVTVRRAVRMGIWAALIFSVIAIPLMLNAEAILLALGQVPELAALADSYLQIAAWALIMNLFHSVLRSFLAAFERANIVLYAMLGGLALNILLNYAFIFGNLGAPAMGIRGAAIATVGSNLLVSAILLIYALSLAEIRKYDMFTRFWRPDWSALLDVYRLGWPISLTLLAEVSLFALSSLMLGWLGTMELAAHGIALQISSVTFMVPLGLSFASTVRVGRALGRRDIDNLLRASVVVMLIAVAVSIAAAALFLLAPAGLIGLFLDNDKSDAIQIIAYGSTLLAVAALFQVVDTVQVVALGLLRGLKDTRVPMLVAVASYLVFGSGVAYVLGFTLGMGGVGVWLGLALGLGIAAVLLVWRYVVLLRHLQAGITPLPS